MLASSTDGTNDESINGIVQGHAYTVLSWHKVNDKYGAETKLVRMRNPWGKGEWTGPWSDHDEENWTDDLK